MTDNEIIKALECCGRESCFGCPYCGKCHQGNPMITDALCLITRQQVENKRLEKEVNLVSIQFQDLQERYEESQAEIERLKVDLAKCSIRLDNLYKTADEIKSEAIKEFAEKIKQRERIMKYDLFPEYAVSVKDIDDMLNDGLFRIKENELFSDKGK